MTLDLNNTSSLLIYIDSKHPPSKPQYFELGYNDSKYEKGGHNNTITLNRMNCE